MRLSSRISHRSDSFYRNRLASVDGMLVIAVANLTMKDTVSGAIDISTTLYNEQVASHDVEENSDKAMASSTTCLTTWRLRTISSWHRCSRYVVLAEKKVRG